MKDSPSSSAAQEVCALLKPKPQILSTPKASADKIRFTTLIQKGRDFFHESIAKMTELKEKKLKNIDTESPQIDFARRNIALGIGAVIAAEAFATITPTPIKIATADRRDSPILPIKFLPLRPENNKPPSRLSYEELLTKEKYERIVLLSNIPDAILTSRDPSLPQNLEERVVQYMLKNPVQIQLRRFTQHKKIYDQLLLSDIIPDVIGAMKTEKTSSSKGLEAYRIPKGHPLFTEGDFYTGFRSPSWRQTHHKKQEETEDSSSNSSKGLADPKKGLILDDSNRLQFKDGTTIHCLELQKNMHREKAEGKKQTAILIDPKMDIKEHNNEHKEIDDFLLKKDEKGEFKYLSKAMLPCDVLTLNIGIKRILKHILTKFSNVKISSGRRSLENNEKSGGAQQSRHLAGAAIDIVGSTNNADLNAKIVENVEAYLISHGFDKSLYLLCHGEKSSYHLHIHDQSLANPKTFEECRKMYGKQVEANPRKQDPFHNALSPSDKAACERHGFGWNTIVKYFFHQTDRAHVAQKLAGEDLATLIQHV